MKAYIYRSTSILLLLFLIIGWHLKALSLPTHAADAPHYSISHYVSFSNAAITVDTLRTWARRDAAKEDPYGDNAQCTGNYYKSGIVTILDFGRPAPSGGVYGIYNWQKVFYSFSDLATFTYDYAAAWFQSSGVCSHLTMAIGINNSEECVPAYDASCFANEGYAFANAVHDAENMVRHSGMPNFSTQINIEGADDIEDGVGFDTYNQTVALVRGYASYPIAYSLYDYGAAFSCGGMCDTGNSHNWDDGEIYNLAWGIGADVPMPEAYNLPFFAQEWAQIAQHTANGKCGDCVGNGGTMQFYGVISDDGTHDQAINFWKDAGITPAINLDVCMPGLPTSENGGSAPCD